MSKKLSIENLRETFSKEGCKLLTEIYSDRNGKLEYICSEGHQGETSWTKWNAGARCPVCTNNNKRLSYKTIFDSFSEVGYQLLTKEYQNVGQKLEYVCPEGHNHTISFRNWKQGNRCPTCANKIKGKWNTLSYSYVKEAFEKEDYTLLSSSYQNSLSELKYQCPLGHEGKVTWDKWKSGQRCTRCSWDRISEQYKTPFEEIKKAFEVEGYQLLETEFKGRHFPLAFICPKGHTHVITWNNWCLNHRCGHCGANTSKAELEIVEIFKNLKPIRTRKLIAPKEIDIYFEKEKVAIEYCGLYWHSIRLESEKHIRIVPSFHYSKMKECNEKGVRLITIFEDEWRDKKQLCISRINAALNIDQTRIAARKCICKEITQEVARDFLEANHLQGSSGREIAYGLFFEDKLVSVMTLGKPSRAHISKDKRVLELKRFASLPNTIIVGGASKLFKRAIEYARLNNYEEIRSYCDMRWGTGGVYKQLGMTLLGETKYTPHYTDYHSRWRNQSFASNKLLTEKERVSIKKVYQIYDCGHQTWCLNLPIYTGCTS